MAKRQDPAQQPIRFRLSHCLHPMSEHCRCCLLSPNQFSLASTPNLPYSQLVLAQLWQLIYCIDYSKGWPYEELCRFFWQLRMLRELRLRCKRPNQSQVSLIDFPDSCTRPIFSLFSLHRSRSQPDRKIGIMKQQGLCHPKCSK